MSIIKDSRPAIDVAVPKHGSPAGPDTLNGQFDDGAHTIVAVEGQISPQATGDPAPITAAPAGTNTSRSHRASDTQSMIAAADNFPGRHVVAGSQEKRAAGEQDPPAQAMSHSAPKVIAPGLADPLLALAADILDDLEKVRIGNENRLRQLTRSTEDGDGEVRGFGLDEAHPDVARLAALVGMLADAEHKAVLNLQHAMRKHPLGPWAKAQKGLGEKQVARLLASIGDPYIRPEIVREDGTVEPSRPRTVGELRAYCGYGEDPENPGQVQKRRRGQHANWSATAKMRAFLIAESCIKQSGTPYRAVYDATRAKYAEAVHAAECVRCGPKGKSAQPGSALSDGHKHARALREVAKAVLRDLWREAKRIHETPGSGQTWGDTHTLPAADGPDIPADQTCIDTHSPGVGGGRALQAGAA